MAVTCLFHSELQNMNEDLAADKIIEESNININNQVAENEDTLTTINCDEEISQILNLLDEDDESEIAMLLSDISITDDDNWEQCDLNQFHIATSIEESSESSPMVLKKCCAHPELFKLSFKYILPQGFVSKGKSLYQIKLPYERVSSR